MIKKGWRPIGGLTCSPNGVVHQAMVHDDKRPRTEAKKRWWQW